MKAKVIKTGEIERLKKILEESTYYLDNSQQALGYSFALDDFKEFIDSLPEETSCIYDTNELTPTPSVNIEDVARVQFASHAHVFDRKRKAVFDWEQFKEVVGIFYGFGKKNSLPEEKPSEDLEEAAEKFARSYDQGTCDGIIQDGFKAGAKWMESQMPMPEDTVIFQKGVAEGRRLEREEIPRWKKGPADSAIRTRDYWPVSNAPVLGKPETRDYLIVKRGKSMALAFHAEEGDYYLSTEELDKIPTE